MIKRRIIKTILLIIVITVLGIFNNVLTKTTNSHYTVKVATQQLSDDSFNASNVPVISGINTLIDLLFWFIYIILIVNIILTWIPPKYKEKGWLKFIELYKE